MRTIIIGFDAFDAGLFERLHNEGRLPHLGKYAENKGYARLAISNPAQSEVSWTSIATGLNPGGHGLFDFVHRNPANYALNVSLLPTKQSAMGTQFEPPHNAHTLFDQAVQDGYPATSLWWPATFPARPESPVQTIPGLGTPDIFGRLGVGFLFTGDPESEAGDKRKTQIESLSDAGGGKFSGKLPGPAGKTLTGVKETGLDLTLSIQGEGEARLQIGKTTLELAEGAWSPIFEVTFKIGMGVSIRGITRAILSQTAPTPKLYLLPLQMHPLATPWRYATPGGFIKKAWQSEGPFLTLGWPQDTTGLEEDCISDEQFLELCDLVVQERERVLRQQLVGFREGVLACVFDTLDRVQHMFWRDRQDVIEAWYAKLDALLGRIEAEVDTETPRVIVLSDHGFTNFNHKVHLNRWLIDKGYMTATKEEPAGNLKSVDWTKTQAYALGLNSVYLNLAGRESQGAVNQSEKGALAKKLRDELLQWKGPDGQTVVQHAWTQEEAFEGPLAEYGPDVVVGYRPGYRASAESGLGEWEAEAVEVNSDHWGADHCIDPESVPGVLFCNHGLENLPNPSFRDIPELALGKPFESTGSSTPPSYSEEADEIVEQRLKDLGYL